MRINKLPCVLWFFAAFHGAAFSVENNAVEEQQPPIAVKESPVQRINTFGDLVKLQGEAAAAKLNAEINSARSAGKAAAAQAGQTQDANPLMNANQKLRKTEPTLEAIWGMAGREVAEIHYNGQRYAVNRLKPKIPGGDNWELEDIKPYQVTMVQKSGAKVIRRKEITLNWQGNIGGAPDSMGISAPSLNGLR